jgi:hypothetical protein
MQTERLAVVSVDCLSGQTFLLYFSDETYTKVSAQDLANCFPDREKYSELND